LFPSILALELAAGEAGQLHHVEAGPQIDGGGLVLADFRPERLLFGPGLFCLPIKLLRCDPAVELVFVHGVEPSLQPVPLVLPVLDGSLPDAFVLLGREREFPFQPLQH
jgi:hypothetical protein